MKNIMSDFFAIFFLATFVEGLVEYLFAKAGKTQPILKYVSLAFGIAVAVAYKVDIPSIIGLHASFGYVNYVISGIAIGRGSNYVNDLFSMIREKTSPTQG